MNARFFTLFFILLVVPMGGLAAKPAASPLERLRRLPVPDNDCPALEADLKAAQAPSLGRNGPIIRESKVDWIVRRLESLSFVDDDLSAVVATAFAEKPKEAYGELLRIGDGECIVPVHRMIKILVNTAVEPGQSPGRQKKIVDAIRKWFKGARPPTLARARVDFEILESALREGMWKIPPEKTKSMERERDSLSALCREFNKTYYGEEAPKEVSLEKADFKKIQSTLVREVREATTFMSWAKAFVAELP